MVERATFCPRCKRMHTGVCTEARAPVVPKPKSLHDVPGVVLASEMLSAEQMAALQETVVEAMIYGSAAVKMSADAAGNITTERVDIADRDGTPPAIETKEIIAGQIASQTDFTYPSPKFDKTAYQREYMRRKRAEAKAK